MTETSHIEFELFGVQIHAAQVVDQDIDAMFSLTTRGHLVSTEVEVKSSRELFTRAPDFALNLMDVKRFERHGPAW